MISPQWKWSTCASRASGEPSTKASKQAKICLHTFSGVHIATAPNATPSKRKKHPAPHPKRQLASTRAMACNSLAASSAEAPRSFAIAARLLSHGTSTPGALASKPGGLEPNGGSAIFSIPRGANPDHVVKNSQWGGNLTLGGGQFFDPQLAELAAYLTWQKQIRLYWHSWRGRNMSTQATLGTQPTPRNRHNNDSSPSKGSFPWLSPVFTPNPNR